MSANERQARVLAEQFREEHDLGERPLGDLFELVAACLGLDVLAMEAPSQGLMRRAVQAYNEGVLALEEVALWYDGDVEELRAELGEPAFAPSVGRDAGGVDADGDADGDPGVDPDDAPLVPAHLAHLFPSMRRSCSMPGPA